MIEIRKATHEDREALGEFLKRQFKALDLEFIPGKSDGDIENMEAYAHRGLFLVIEDKKKEIIGTAGIREMSSTLCKIGKLYLDKRIRYMGFGHVLMNMLLSAASQHEFEMVLLDTHTEKLPGAAQFFNGIGFKKYGNQEKLPEGCNIRLYKNIEQSGKINGIRF